eukprot:TRINITY_DN10271_c0_g1_i1.p1 TRINITY_DN10271_c0_g1~~TRINITY_DN10271_c0_g1_i1.p1  ORF type:complete len:914 (-),score=92.44 TRINITY_DN10271_c0_g1_i1:287-3028(-)
MQVDHGVAGSVERSLGCSAGYEPLRCVAPCKLSASPVRSATPSSYSHAGGRVYPDQAGSVLPQPQQFGTALKRFPETESQACNSQIQSSTPKSRRGSGVSEQLPGKLEIHKGNSARSSQPLQRVVSAPRPVSPTSARHTPTRSRCIHQCSEPLSVRALNGSVSKRDNLHPEVSRSRECGDTFQGASVEGGARSHAPVVLGQCRGITPPPRTSLVPELQQSSSKNQEDASMANSTARLRISASCYRSGDVDAAFSGKAKVVAEQPSACPERHCDPPSQNVSLCPEMSPSRQDGSDARYELRCSMSQHSLTPPRDTTPTRSFATSSRSIQRSRLTSSWSNFSSDSLLRSNSTRSLSPGLHSLGFDVGEQPERATTRGHVLLFPFWARGHDDINDKYIVHWDQPIHVGGLNGINSTTVGACTCMSRTVKALTKKTRACRAVKIVSKAQIRYPKLLQSQCSAARDIDHQNICKVFDVFEDTRHVYIVMEYLAGPSLVEKAISDPHFCERDAAAAFKALLQALMCLHSEHTVVHQNLHPENVRYLHQAHKQGAGGSVYDQGLKLMDFGLAMPLKHLSSVLHGSDDAPLAPPLQLIGCRSSGGSVLIAPELRGKSADSFGQVVARLAGFRDEKKPTVKEIRESQALLEAGDMWAAGCILHLLLSGKWPSEDVAVAGCTVNLPEGVHPAARHLCTSLLQPNPRERPPAAVALRSNWFYLCELFKQGHRSVTTVMKAAVVTPVTPVSLNTRLLMQRHALVGCFRKLVICACGLLVSTASSRVSLSTCRSSVADCPEVTLGCFPEGTTTDFAAQFSVVEDKFTKNALSIACTGVFSMFLQDVPKERRSVSPRRQSSVRDGISRDVQRADLLCYVELADAAGPLPWSDPLGTALRMFEGYTVISETDFLNFVQTSCSMMSPST